MPSNKRSEINQLESPTFPSDNSDMREHTKFYAIPKGKPTKKGACTKYCACHVCGYQYYSTYIVCSL